MFIVGSILVCCGLGMVVLGIWVGSRYFYRTRTVYVMREIQQEEAVENEEENENMIED